MAITGGITSGGGSSGLESVFALIAQDPVKFQAQITEYQEAAAKATAAAELLAKAEEIPALHEAAKKAEQDAGFALMNAEVEAKRIVDEAIEKADGLIQHANDEVHAAKDRLGLIQAEIEAANAERAKVQAQIGIDRAEHDNLMGRERAEVERKQAMLEDARNRAVAAEKAAIGLSEEYKGKLDRLKAIVME